MTVAGLANLAEGEEDRRSPPEQVDHLFLAASRNIILPNPDRRIERTRRRSDLDSGDTAGGAVTTFL
jgi:hypothetical protein